MRVFLGSPAVRAMAPEPHPAPTDSKAAGRQLRVLMVCMPWFGIHVPSLALSTLAPIARSSAVVSAADIRYLNIEWAELLYQRSNKRLDSAWYRRISYGDPVGEWIFSGALYDDQDPRHSAYYQLAVARGDNLDEAEQVYSMAADFIEQAADQVAACAYDVVGFTTTFMQNVPSLALARAIKQRDERIITILGGANCDDVQGSALHRNFPFIDYVVRGEGEHTFATILRHVAGAPAPPLAEVAGLCWRSDGQSVANALNGVPLGMAEVPEPSYDDYFAMFHAAQVCHDVRPRIVMEGSRGCWWGQKHHCTFCGLNGSLMPFRSKPAERLLKELGRAVQRHRVLDILFTDNIMDLAHVQELLPRLADTGWDLRMTFEVKANLRYQQLALLAEAGISVIQPGIESLITDVLKLMRKGVTSWQNIRFLRDCTTVGIDTVWNILYGFPGEVERDYLSLVERMPALVHINPPDGLCRVNLTRFSPYFDDPSLGLVNLGPAADLAAAYHLPRREIADLVYMFDSAESGVRGAAVDGLEKAVGQWRARHAGRRLVALRDGNRIVLADARQQGKVREMALDERESLAYRALLRGRTPGAVANLAAGSGTPVQAGWLAERLAAWRDDGYVFQDGSHYVALATGLGWT